MKDFALANPFGAIQRNEKTTYTLTDKCCIHIPKGTRVMIFENDSEDCESDVIPVEVILPDDIATRFSLQETGDRIIECEEAV